MILFLVFALAGAAQASAPAAPADPAAELSGLVAKLRQKTDDEALRTQIIRLALSMKPRPAIPKEAVQHMKRGADLFRKAAGRDDFEHAAQEFQQATLAAPWLADAYGALGAARGMAEDSDGAAENLKLYLLAAPNAANADLVRKKIATLDDVGEIEWVAIPGGMFMMGSESGNPDERPAHRVTVHPFEIARTLVTNRQYNRCVLNGPCPPQNQNCLNPDLLLGCPHADFSDPDQPAVCVDWMQARIFSQWAGGRLPTEAEWEYAARGAGRAQRYPWGNEEAARERAVVNDGVGGCGRKATEPVCSKPRGNTAQGLCDMAGNVWEWVLDGYHRSYAHAPADGSAWDNLTGSYRVIRGGSWLSDPASARATCRNADPGFFSDDIGFRPVRRR